jgi:glycosyltransferase involved in cell wall biosynthesis
MTNGLEDRNDIGHAADPSAAGRTRLCVVSPVFNEEANLPELTRRLRTALDGVPGLDWHVVFVNDGSCDRTAPMIVELGKADGRFGLVDLSRNFGHQAALSAGLAYADGDVVVLMDSDLQDPPELLPELIAKWKEGFEVVYAVRRNRKESGLKKAAYFLFYRINRFIAQIEIPLDAGDFCLMDRVVVDALQRLPEYNRFLRGLRSWVGFRQTGLEYDRPDRFAGTTKYPFWKLLNLAVSGFLGFSTVPLRAAAWLGLATACLGLLLVVWAVGSRLLGINVQPGWASQMATMLVLGGVQLVMLGVLGEYVGNINDEVRRRPIFIVRKTYRVGPMDDREAASPMASVMDAAPAPDATSHAPTQTAPIIGSGNVASAERAE